MGKGSCCLQSRHNSSESHAFSFLHIFTLTLFLPLHVIWQDPRKKQRETIVDGRYFMILIPGISLFVQQTEAICFRWHHGGRLNIWRYVLVSQCCTNTSQMQYKKQCQLCQPLEKVQHFQKSNTFTMSARRAQGICQILRCLYQISVKSFHAFLKLFD